MIRVGSAIFSESGKLALVVSVRLPPESALNFSLENSALHLLADDVVVFTLDVDDPEVFSSLETVHECGVFEMKNGELTAEEPRMAYKV